MKIRIVLKSGYTIDVDVEDWAVIEDSFHFTKPSPAVHVEDSQIAAVIELDDGVTEPKKPFGFDNQHNVLPC